MIVTIFIIHSNLVCVHMLVAQVCLTLFKPVDYSLPGSSVHGVPQATILEGVSVLFSRGFSQPRDRTQVFHIAGSFFTT